MPNIETLLPNRTSQPRPVMIDDRDSDVGATGDETKTMMMIMVVAVLGCAVEYDQKYLVEKLSARWCH